MAQQLDVRERWRQAAARWRAHGDFVRTATAPVSRALLESATPVPGQVWLDVAAGIGDPASDLVAAVGPDGVVVATDLIPEMIATARDLVQAGRDSRSSRFLAVSASAERIPARRSTFDGVTCRFGAMFFDDPETALREMREVLSPGGCGAFAIWSTAERNPFFSDMNAALRETIPDFPVPEPDDPHVFRFAPDGKLVAVLEATGWIGIEQRRLEFTMATDLGHRDLWDSFVGLSVELAELVRSTPGEQVAAIRASFEDRIEPHFAEGVMRFPAEAWIVTGRAP